MTCTPYDLNIKEGNMFPQLKSSHVSPSLFSSCCCPSLALPILLSSVQIHDDVNSRDKNFGCDEDDDDPFEIFT
jgi:hypothetical protein